MPNNPAPYLMRDWQQVALGYDSLVFNYDLTGQYLPLIFDRTNTINYSNHNSFGLHTVVGTTSPTSGEAINVLPAVIGSSLSGIDKSNQNGINWVLMCEEYFNRANNANVYLNHPSGSNWDDWWYDVMPNVFFYQLYDLYPETGDFTYQFSKTADRWLDALEVMGGSSTPWHNAFMYYRAFNLMTMTPSSDGVAEPEAAGSIAWLLYNAYIETNNSKYRIGAEWALEYLEGLSVNPSYELQLAYGAYIAARMNAEIGTTYDIEKIVNWCFNIGPLRNWGVVLGNWGSRDVSGLIGEVNGSNDYAFLMNTFEQIGALVPLVRYDNRFARAIGKWVLNAANASRLLYPNFLPDNNQDSEEWAHQYDPYSYIAHEAMRESLYGQSPYATGDAISGGWGLTNLALYGSSHVGILGGIIDTTNIEKILKLDLLKTDYYNDEAFPSYLIFNPYFEDKLIDINTGIGTNNIYDAVSNSTLAAGVSGNVSLLIPANEAVIAVIIPSTGVITFEQDKMFVNGITADYSSGQIVDNYPPRIKSLASDSSLILIGSSSQIYCTAVDRDNDSLSYSWSTTGGSLSGEGPHVTWTAPNNAGTFRIICNVSDNNFEVPDSIEINVVEQINNDPEILKIIADPRIINPGNASQINCMADDQDGDELIYTWFSQLGSFDGSGSSVFWNAPLSIGNYYINCSVEDGNGGLSSDSILVSVRDTSIHQTGDMVAYYPFNGNADDASGFDNNGVVNGAVLIPDRWGNPISAYMFDGVNDNIIIPNSTNLNFQNAITINFWIKVDEFFDREAYPISHGNWENRWKVSITNKRIRWTIKTSSGIKDLDSETELKIDSLYNITTIYDGNYIEIYINGKLDALSNYSGELLTTTIDLSIGQVLPGNNQYNFKGVLDDIRIYNYALHFTEVENLYDIVTSVNNSVGNNAPESNFLFQNYPNPFNSETLIRFQISETSFVSIEIFNILGRRIRLLINRQIDSGSHLVIWDGKDSYGSFMSSGIYFYKISAGNYRQTNKLILLK